MKQSQRHFRFNRSPKYQGVTITSPSNKTKTMNSTFSPEYSDRSAPIKAYKNYNKMVKPTPYPLISQPLLKSAQEPQQSQFRRFSGTDNHHYQNAVVTIYQEQITKLKAENTDLLLQLCRTEQKIKLLEKTPVSASSKEITSREREGKKYERDKKLRSGRSDSKEKQNNSQSLQIEQLRIKLNDYDARCRELEKQLVKLRSIMQQKGYVPRDKLKIFQAFNIEFNERKFNDRNPQSKKMISQDLTGKSPDCQLSLPNFEIEYFNVLKSLRITYDRSKIQEWRAFFMDVCLLANENANERFSLYQVNQQLQSNNNALYGECQSMRSQLDQQLILISDLNQCVIKATLSQSKNRPLF